MSKNFGSNIMIVIAVALLAVGVLFFLNANPSGAGGLIETKNKIQCDVTVENDLFGTAKIKTFNCRNVGGCLFSFTTIPFGILGQKGEVRLTASDAFDAKEFEVGSVNLPLLPSTQVTKSLEICTKERNGEIQLFDTNFNRIDMKQWVI